MVEKHRKIETIFNEVFNQYPQQHYPLSSLLRDHPEINFEDIEIWFNSLYENSSRPRHYDADDISREIQGSLYTLARDGHVDLANSLRKDLNNFRKKEKLPIYRSRIDEFEHFLGTGKVTPVEMLHNIPDLTLDELMEEARTMLDPYGDSKNLYKTPLFIKSQKDIIERFLREAVGYIESRHQAIKLGIGLGIWSEQETEDK